MSDLQTQLLLGQLGQGGQRSNTHSAMAQRLMQSAVSTPAYTSGAGIAQALSAALAGFMGGKAQMDERAERRGLLNQITKREDNQRRGAADFGALLAGRAPGVTLPQSPPEVAAATAMPPGPPAVPMMNERPAGPLTGAPVQQRGEAPMAVSEGIAARRALDPNAPDYAQRIMEINNGVVQRTMPGMQPRPVAQGVAGVAPAQAGAPPSATPVQPVSATPAMQGAPNMALIMQGLTSDNPAIVRQAQAALQMAQLQQRQDQPRPTVTMVGPQGAGVYERLPGGGLRFLGGQPEGAPVSAERHRQDLERAGAGRPSVEVRTGQNFAEQLASGAARQIGELQASARTAAEGLRSADRITDLLEGGVITGTGAEARLGIERALRTAGLIDGRRVANTEQLMAELARGTLEAAGGLSGPTSDRDILFLREVAGGSIALTPETLARIASVVRARNERTISRYNDLAGIVSRDESLTPAMRELYRPLDFPTREPRAPAPPAGAGGGWSIRPVQ